MAKTIEIRLEEPLVGHGGAISVVKVREPRAGDVLDIGEPIVFARAEQGALISVENDDKIRRYIERLTLDDTGKPIDPNILAQGSAADIIRIREAVLDFFTEARARALNPRSA